MGAFFRPPFFIMAENKPYVPVCLPNLRGRYHIPSNAPQVTPQVTPQDNLWDDPYLVLVVNAVQGEMGRDEIQGALELKDRKSFRERYLAPALEQGLLEMTIPDKPTSRNQRYRLTLKGLGLKNSPRK